MKILVTKKHPGFSLLEMAIAILVLGVLMTMSARLFLGRKPFSTISGLHVELNSLAGLAQRQAIESGALCRLVVEPYAIGGVGVYVETMVENGEFEKIQVPMLISSILTSNEFVLQEVAFISKEQEWTFELDQGKAIAFFLPQGCCEPMMLNWSANYPDKAVDFGLALNPLTARFDLIDKHIKLSSATKVAI